MKYCKLFEKYLLLKNFKIKGLKIKSATTDLTFKVNIYGLEATPTTSRVAMYKKTLRLFNSLINKNSNKKI